VAQKPVITALRSRGCRADIVHYCITGGAHEWLSNAAFDTTTEAWRFVAGHYV
jgi:hypothetical protein